MKKSILGGLAAGAVALGLAAAGPAHADFIFDTCPSGMDGVVTATPTSCPFADNVRRGYFTQGSSDVIAWSPVTGNWYDMDCSNTNFVAHLGNGRSHPGVLCTGGIDAAVVVW